ncbi:hypothetical protein HETIRDRAFT_318186 [Heterobasidion irregulare TC 32-1]|uniref:VPS37 C-terminal domain-containing protein n=1 Tax=Heterobasidion irregulare (strain TC 32-1) TaxID=747525 RepID=W4K7F3_HETIT|nr:uncharacterized protein HETIRDRAFT_318186 [Heterobasidion irregulare TC 32-1]ETW81694.1 hypothetical protein HETIRDRAFT_318186 [Heterobasidion irregulare TC 32-1]
MSNTTQLLTEFPELSHLSREDLEDMLVDPAYFQAVFHTLTTVKELYRAQAELGLANESIAKQNLSVQDEVYRMRSETKDAFDEAKALEARWAELEREQKEVFQRFNPQFLLMRLRHATTAQDDLSEALASTFVRSSASEVPSPSTNGKDVDDFVKEFRELRKTYHKRVMWGDRWAAGQVAWRDD